MMKSILRNLQSKLWPAVLAPVLAMGIGASIALISVADIRNSGQVKIRGGLPNEVSPFPQWEERLQGEILRNDGPEEIFALLTSEYSRVASLIIRVRGGRAKIYFYQDLARELYREMTDLELEKLRTFINERSIDDLKPDIPGGNHVYPHEYLHLKKEGGRRVIIGTSPLGFFIKYHEIYKFFSQFVRSDGLKARYEIMDNLKGGEVLFVDMEEAVQGVCTSNGSIQVLLGQKGALSALGELLIEKYDLSSTEWRYFSQGRLGDKVNPLAVCPIISAIDDNVPENLPRTEDGRRQADPHQTWQSRVKNGTILGADWGQISGLWKFSARHKPQLLATGPYFSPITTPDGKWVVAAKGRGYQGDRLGFVRVSLETGRQYKIDLPSIPDTWEGVDSVETVAFVPAHNKILLRLLRVGSALLEWENFLLDPATGLSEKVSGEFSPLTQQSYRPLQPTGRPNEFWAAIPREWLSPNEPVDAEKNYTEIGRYNTKSFVFIPLIKFPKMMFDSMQIWGDEAEDKVYLAYNGHLLRLSLQQ
jgi:hypothetical protein